MQSSSDTKAFCSSNNHPAIEAGTDLGFIPMKFLLAEVAEQVQKQHDMDEACFRVPTGFIDLDKKILGFQPGNLIILAGCPSIGKTTLALNIAANIASDSGLAVGLFSISAASTQLVASMLSSAGRVSMRSMATGTMADNEWSLFSQAMGKLSEVPIYIDGTTNLDLPRLFVRASKLAKLPSSTLGLLIIDDMQGMVREKPVANQALEIAELTRALKSLATELNVPILALSQLSRKIEKRPNKRPQMYDVCDMGISEADADVVLLMYREERYCFDTPHKGIVEVILGKQRNGPTGTVRLVFQDEYMSFENMAGDGWAM